MKISQYPMELRQKFRGYFLDHFIPGVPKSDTLLVSMPCGLVIVIVLFGTDKAMKVNTVEQYTAPNRTQRVEKQPLTCENNL